MIILREHPQPVQLAQRINCNGEYLPSFAYTVRNEPKIYHYKRDATKTIRSRNGTEEREMTKNEAIELAKVGLLRLEAIEITSTYDPITRKPTLRLEQELVIRNKYSEALLILESLKDKEG